jgi:hypothetical protein
MSSKNKKNTSVPSRNQEVEGLRKTVDSLLKSGKSKEDEIIITLNQMIKERS